MIRTDHASLKYIKTLRDPDDQFARWIERLEETKYTIEIRQGKKHANADALSRLPSSTCAGKKCICAGVQELEASGDIHDSYITQARIDAAYVRRHSATSGETTDDDSSGDDSSTDDDYASLIERLKSRMEDDRRADEAWLEEMYPDRGDINAPSTSQHANEVESGTIFPTCAQARAPETTAEGVPGDLDLLAFTSQWDAAAMSRAQETDADIGPIYRAKKADDKRPVEAIIGGYSRESKAYLHDWNRLHINGDGVMCRTFESHDGLDTWQQVILPLNYRRQVCRQFHDVSEAAHMGRRKTVRKLQRRYHWHRMAEDVRWWIATCDICQKRKCPRAWPKAPMQLYLAGEPNERVAMDIVDHIEPSNSGNCCVLSITDHFTKYVKAIPLPNQTAETIADAFVRGWVAVFGAPHMLHTDQGRNFDSELIAEVCKMFNIYKTRTTAYHPAGNGLTERYNRCIMDMIHAHVRLDPSEWDRALALACYAYNSTPHTSTGLEPNRLMLGRNTYMPVDRMMPANINSQHKTVLEYARELDDNVRNAHRIARERINRAATSQKKYYDRSAHLNRYKVGDTVQLKVFRKEKGLGKFADKFEGPYYILDVLSDVNFRIIRAMEEKPRVVHHDHIVPYLEREPEAAMDKAWIYRRSRTYKAPPSDAAAQTDMGAAQAPTTSTVAQPVENDTAVDSNDVEQTSNSTVNDENETHAVETRITRSRARKRRERSSPGASDVKYPRRHPQSNDN